MQDCREFQRQNVKILWINLLFKLNTLLFSYAKDFAVPFLFYLLFSYETWLKCRENCSNFFLIVSEIYFQGYDTAVYIIWHAL